MDNKALYNLSYGVFVLGARNGDKINACITNTCIQVASDPVRIVISVLNKNFTCGMIKETCSFSLSVLDNTCTFDLIKHFGMQSGKDTDKFKDFAYKIDDSDCPYITEHVCSVLRCKVLSMEDLGTHTVFIAEVKDAVVTGSNPPLTYAEYQSKIKPKPEINQEKEIVGWRCKICGFEIMEKELPADYVCPLCGHPREDFEPIYAK